MRGYTSRVSFTFCSTVGHTDCMLPELSMTKMMYSLSTGIPPTVVSLGGGR